MYTCQSPSIPCEIRGIRIAKRQNLPQLTINITGVRVLVIEHHIDFKWFLGSGSMSGNLVWLRLCHCHLRSIPPAISLQNLRVLEVEGSGSELQYSFRRIVKEGKFVQHRALKYQLLSTDHHKSTSRKVVQRTGNNLKIITVLTTSESPVKIFFHTVQ